MAIATCPDFSARDHAPRAPWVVETSGQRLACIRVAKSGGSAVLHFHGNGEVAADWSGDFAGRSAQLESMRTSASTELSKTVGSCSEAGAATTAGATKSWMILLANVVDHNVVVSGEGRHIPATVAIRARKGAQSRPSISFESSSGRTTLEGELTRVAQVPTRCR